MSDAVVTAPAQVVVRDIDLVAKKMMELAPAYTIRKTGSKTFRCLTLAENENENWKKGLVYFMARYSKGVNVEHWLYSTKGGVHLMEYNDLFRALATDQIKCEPCGKAVKLRIQVLDSDTDEVMAQKITDFMNAIEPTVTEVRSKVVVHVSPKKTSKAKAEVAAPAEPTPVEPVTAVVPEIPSIPEEITEPAPAAPKSKAKSKAKK